jgi:phosphoribosylformimino-5-aminoimidazole carboxamide ribotide isomerase
MIVIPAIDLRQGRVVRLTQGDPERSTRYGEDPVAAARRFEREGAALLHVVDLDAALETGSNRIAIEAVCNAVDIPVQIGGGIRTHEAIDDVMGLGAARTILGSAAVWSADFVRDAVSHWGDRIVVALDVRDGLALALGWKEPGPPFDELLPDLDAAGSPRYLMTSVVVDGTMEGPDVSFYEDVLAATDRPLIASGGVRNIDHLRALAAIGVEGVVVGRALYEGQLTLADALAEVRP